MKLSIKKVFTVLCILAVFSVSIVQSPSAHAQITPSINASKAIAFIRDVIQPDLSKYNVTLINDIVGHPLNQSSTTQESIDYHLDANGSGPDILCIFTNNTMTAALLSISPNYAHIESSPTLYTTNPSTTNLTNKVIASLAGYQTYTGENLQSMINALTNFDATQNITRISGNIKLTIENIQLETDVSLKYTANGTDYTGISFAFRNGQFYSFRDDRNLWTIGNTNVNISQSQAISIAQQYVQNYFYTLDDGTLVKGFNVISIQADLNTYPRDNSTTIFPYWRLQLNLGAIYPGNVYALSIGIWADSGTVFLAQPIGSGGGFPLPSSTATPSQPAQYQSQTGISPINLSAIMAIAAVIVIIISAIVLKKRSK